MASAELMSHNPGTAWQIPGGANSWGENVAVGYGVYSVTGAWIGSAGHRANIERSSFTHIGIGVACAGGIPYYTQTFAGYGGSSGGSSGGGSASVPSTRRPPAPPQKLTTALPTVSGTTQVELPLRAETEGWTSGTEFSYQWFADGKAIESATSAVFTPGPEHIGATITVTVNGTKAGFESASQTSEPTAVVAGFSTLSTERPAILGQPKSGVTLCAVTGEWTEGSAFSYQWFADLVAIEDATAVCFTLTPDHLGALISVTVTGKIPGYTAVAEKSAWTLPVVAFGEVPGQRHAGESWQPPTAPVWGHLPRLIVV